MKISTIFNEPLIRSEDNCLAITNQSLIELGVVALRRDEINAFRRIERDELKYLLFVAKHRSKQSIVNRKSKARVLPSGIM